MIKIAKKRSYKLLFYRLFYAFLYLVLPLYLFFGASKIARLLYWVYSFNLLLILLSWRKKIQQSRLLKLKTQDLSEKVNLLNNDNAREKQNNLAWKEKIERYQRLKGIIEEINRQPDLETVANNLATIAFSLIAKNRGVCLLYLVGSHAPINLNLFKARKEDSRLVIKAKEGDIFDFWVLRHSSALLIEDIRRDFRFDPEKLKLQDTRTVSSLISAPLISHHRFLGILRLDSAQSAYYSQDDLRFLVSISDLGAVALENGEFFQKTQDLATHDELTRLYTKGYFLERLREECSRALRQKRTFSLLMLDIDYFKHYNDTFGHSAGDLVLKTLSQVLRQRLANLESILGRFGGEEFCIILPGADKKRAGAIAEDLRLEIEKTKIILRRQENHITVSIGVVDFSAGAGNAEELIQKADKAMYTAKERGRNRICLV